VQARPREWVIGLVSAAVGVAATLLLLVAFGGLGDRNRSPLPPPAIIPPNAVVDYTVATRVLEAGAPSVVTVRAIAGDTTNTVGSGVAVSSNRVLTSLHLLIGAGSVVIITSEDRTYPAKIMGFDLDTDLALLDVSEADLPYRPLADAPPDIGEPVVALAITKGSDPYVDLRIISRLNRTFSTAIGTTMAGLLQANLDTSPETSGGALFDTNGQIVGILVTPPGVAEFGLAVPIDVADDVRQQIESSGKVTHGWLGLTAVDASDRAGARVTAIVPDSPAANAKLEIGDVITSAGGRDVGDVGDLMAEWRRRRPADSLSIEYHRGRVQRSTTATLTAGPPPAAPDS
jgi:S1-C subfamily serine protease